MSKKSKKRTNKNPKNKKKPKVVKAISNEIHISVSGGSKGGGGGTRQNLQRQRQPKAIYPPSIYIPPPSPPPPPNLYNFHPEPNNPPPPQPNNPLHQQVQNPPPPHQHPFHHGSLPSHHPSSPHSASNSGQSSPSHPFSSHFVDTGQTTPMYPFSGIEQPAEQPTFKFEPTPQHIKKGLFDNTFDEPPVDRIPEATAPPLELFQEPEMPSLNEVAENKIDVDRAMPIYEEPDADRKSRLDRDRQQRYEHLQQEINERHTEITELKEQKRRYDKFMNDVYGKKRDKKIGVNSDELVINSDITVKGFLSKEQFKEYQELYDILGYKWGNPPKLKTLYNRLTTDKNGFHERVGALEAEIDKRREELENEERVVFKTSDKSRTIHHYKREEDEPGYGIKERSSRNHK